MSAAQNLAARRNELVARSAAQRSALIAEAQPLVDTAAKLDRLVGSVRHHPIVTAVAAAGVLLLGARPLFALGARLLTLYALVRR